MSDFRASTERPATVTGVSPSRVYELFLAETDAALINTQVNAEDYANLIQYRFTFDRALRRAGLCSHTNLTISLSRHYIARATEAHIIGTIRHEMAHAMVGPGHGHDATWQDAARRLGTSDSTTFDPSVLAAPVVSPLYVGRTEGDCDCTFTAHRLSKRYAAGVVCTKHRSRVIWTKTR